MTNIVNALLDPNFPNGWVETGVVDPHLTFERVRGLMSACQQFITYGEQPEWKEFPLRLFMASMVGSYYNNAEVAALVMALNTVLSTPAKIDQTLEYHWPPAPGGKHWALIESEMETEPWWLKHVPELASIPPDQPILPLQPFKAYTRPVFDHYCLWFPDQFSLEPHFRQFAGGMDILEFDRRLLRMKVYDNPANQVYDKLYKQWYPRMWVYSYMTQERP